jgi:hypothetical protein
MRQAMSEDPVVGAHYADLDPARFRAETLPEKKQAYVSYRVGEKIFWTRRAVTLQAGETVLTDGSAMLRGRCGNRISQTPRQPVAPAAIEPEEITMDQPVIALMPPPEPAFPADTPVITSKFFNPMQPSEDSALNSYLPPPDALEPLPPVWVTGVAANAGGGIIGVSPAGGGDADSSTNAATGPATSMETSPLPLPVAPQPVTISTGAVSPAIPILPVGAFGTPAPPESLVLASLRSLPETATLLSIPIFPELEAATSGTNSPLYLPLLTTPLPGNPPNPSLPPATLLTPSGSPTPPPSAPPPFSPPAFVTLAPPTVSTPIPEPSTGLFLVLGLLGILAGGFGRRN